MKILITGGTGFIGSHLVEKLVKHNSVILLTRKSSNTSRISHLLSKIKMYQYENGEEIEKIFKENKINLIIHLATTYIKRDATLAEVEKMNATNISLPSTLLYLATKYQVPSFINTGSCAEYKVIRKPIDENGEIRPQNYYASTKVALEQTVKYFAQNGLKALTLKLFFPYGEKDNPNKVITYMVKACVDNQVAKLTKGEQQLAFTYIDDIVDAFLRAIKYITSSRYKSYQAINIGNKETHTVKEAVGIVQKLSKDNLNPDLGAIPYQKNEIMFLSCNFAKAKRLLGWQPKTSFKKGITYMYDYYLKHS